MAKPELGSQISFFLENFLSKPASALPKGSQWVLVFEGPFQDGSTKEVDFKDVLPVPAIRLATKYEPRKWDIEASINATLTKDYQQTKGCLFVQAVSIPGESNVTVPEGLQQSGYIRTFIGGGRDPFANLQISFLETNVSFVDNVIRPWVIATAHLGLIARTGAKNYRCNISVYKLGVISPAETPFVLRKYTFYGVCPVSVTGEEYNYTQISTPVNRETSFIYHYYTIESSVGNLAAINNNANIPVPISTKDSRVNEFIS
jgi:hypothetical protein